MTPNQFGTEEKLFTEFRSGNRIAGNYLFSQLFNPLVSYAMQNGCVPATARKVTVKALNTFRFEYVLCKAESINEAQNHLKEKIMLLLEDIPSTEVAKKEQAQGSKKKRRKKLVVEKFDYQRFYDQLKDMGEKIYEKRISLGISQEMCAKQVDINIKVLIDIEQGKGVRFQDFRWIFKFFGYCPLEKPDTPSEKILHYRYVHGLNQESFGNLFNVSTPAVSGWEKYGNVPGAVLSFLADNPIPYFIDGMLVNV
ncbi:MAG TPA: hypothetical protein VLB02_01095 [Candidatus Paceibacterota bacterium]|nr:hypothetical protein [Candidatus Paceibacterota bacterium]